MIGILIGWPLAMMAVWLGLHGYPYWSASFAFWAVWWILPIPVQGEKKE